MPADSEPTGHLPLPQVWRPLGPRLAGAVGGVALAAICGFAWYALGPEIRAKFSPFQIGTLLFLGGLGYACLHALIRSRVEAHEDRLILVNGYRRREYVWAQVIGVSLPPGAPWATVDLADGMTVAAMGIQGSDGARATRAVRELRALLDSR